MNHSIVALIVFISAYMLFVVLPTRRTWVALSASLVLMLVGTVSFSEAVSAINWNVMGIFVGTLIVADIFMESKVPAFLAEIIVDKARNTTWAVLIICAMTGFISAFVENVATVLIIAPIALELSKKLKINPINIMIAIAISSNLQGAATLIGDPPSMLLGGFAKMNFMDFFFYKGKPSMFFAVQIGACASFLVLYYIFRKHTDKVVLIPIEKILSWWPTIILCVLVLMLALSSFFDTGFSYMAGMLCMGAGIVSLVWKKYAIKGSIIAGIKSLDWDTTLFLIGVFVLVGSITVNGWIDIAAEKLSLMVGNKIFIGYTMIVFISVFLSAFIDNVPFLAAMLPMTVLLSAKLGIQPSLLLFGLLIGSSIGGNITPIGASANIVACSLLKKQGHPVSFMHFVKIGLPFTLVAVSASYLFVWFIWG